MGIERHCHRKLPRHDPKGLWTKQFQIYRTHVKKKVCSVASKMTTAQLYREGRLLTEHLFTLVLGDWYVLYNVQKRWQSFLPEGKHCLICVINVYLLSVYVVELMTASIQLPPRGHDCMVLLVAPFELYFSSQHLNDVTK